MSLTPDEVRHIALLARLGISEEDVERFSSQLSSILDYFEELKQVDTDGVPPTAYALDLHNVLRADETAPCTDHADVLANAPLQENGYFRVRAILEE
ncbi:MAG: Asp-tRNA(Asn)/Glu-tRNA(Gln) amidotransferase subunit GatC [Chloroflexi bacterium]|nr:Asp-tRNA(Asn)/Glu-tRNA(Gln) amidotransferase subunit GatC [Chloroflexota bacterium]MCH8051088.1 Asp-tRNA(Asn)/Glu-tRNA(Gln) amidotransferase subunit GatC [Chloroflexota bacterium]